MDEENERDVVGGMTVLNVTRSLMRDCECETVYTTFDMQNQAERRKAYDAFGNDCVPLRDKVNGEIEVENIVVHPYSGIDEDSGEEYRRIRIVMVSPTGEYIASSSISVARALHRLSAMLRPLPWRPAMKIKVKQVKTRNGQIYDLTPVGE
jgi:hypothetical protein